MPAKKRLIGADDLYRMETISNVRLSPDGSAAVYTIQTVEQKTEKKYTHLWLAPTNGEPARQFTYGKHSNSVPRWSPDGQTIAFISNREDAEKSAQVFLIPAHGGEARALTHIDGEIHDLAWSPDGKSLLLSVRKLDPEAIERQEDENKKKLGVVARHYERVFYKLDGYGYLPKERTHLWTVDARSGRAKQITDHAVFDEYFPAWSPDGKWIAYISNRADDPDMHPDSEDLFVIPAAGGEARKVPAPIGGKSMPVFSPDGKWIAYYASEGEGEWYRNTGLWLVPADGASAPRNLTAAYDIHVADDTMTDASQPETMPPTWANDGQRIYFSVAQHGASLLMSIAVDGSGLQRLLGEKAVVGSFSFDRAQQRMAYFYGTISEPGQVRLHDFTNGGDQQLTHHNAWLEKVDLGEIEEIWFKGPDGNDLQGWVLKPPGFDPAQKYPSILEIHGGPLGQYGWLFMHEFYFLAAKGSVVYFTNPRGGRGYGEAHAGAIHGNWGTADYADLMAWTDLVEKLPYIDTARMGVTGGSYGGYMTVWIIGHTRRFKAAVTQRCVSNFVSMWGSSDFNWIFQQQINNKAPFEDLQAFWDRSPIKYIGSAATPTLVIHSENDLRCPIEQGEQVYVALKRLNVPSEMVRFPNEFHGLSRGGRTDRRVTRLNHIARWFEKYL